MILPNSNAWFDTQFECQPMGGLGKRPAYFIALVLLLDDNTHCFFRRSFSITSEANVSTLLMDCNVMKSVTLIIFATRPSCWLDVEYVSA